MDNLFDQEHIFVVFHQGAGGNFVASLLYGAQQQILDTMSISNRGSAHNLVDNKINGTDYLCYTTFPLHDRLPFDSAVDEYKQSIIDHADMFAKPTVTWTHDFENIRLYRHVFPKAKIVIVRQESIKEKLIVSAMHSLKHFLDPEIKITSTKEQYDNVTRRWESWIRNSIKYINPIISETTINEILNNRYDKRYQPILEFLTVRRAYKYFDILGYVDNGSKEDTVNFLRYIPKSDNVVFSLGASYAELIIGDCYTVDYGSILSKDKLFIDIVILLTGNTDRISIEATIDKYIDKQNSELIEDPVAFYKNRKLTAYSMLKEMQ
jgi:hypothetical protein